MGGGPKNKTKKQKKKDSTDKHFDSVPKIKEETISFKKAQLAYLQVMYPMHAPLLPPPQKKKKTSQKRDGLKKHVIHLSTHTFKTCHSLLLHSVE